MMKPIFMAVLASMLAIPAIPVAAQTAPVLHIATGGKETDAEVFYAQENGYFTKVGLNVDIQVMQNGAAIGSALVAGALQIGSSSTLIAANAQAKGLPFVFIAPGGQYNDATPSSELVVPSASPIKSAADLSGKSVSVLSLRGIDQSSVMKWVDENGGDSSKVRFVEVIPAEMPAALDRGTVDAAMLAEPFLGASRKNTRLLGKAYGSVGKVWLIAGWMATRDWIAQNPDTVRKFQAAMRMSAEWANANPEKAAAVLQKYAKTSVDRIHTTYGLALDPTLIAPVIDIGVKYKVLPKAVPPTDLIASLPK